MKPFRFFAPACIAAATIFAPLAQAQVLKQVPSDALLVIKFNKLKATSDKVAAMAQKLGIAQFSPQMADPLGALKQEGKLTNGLDDAGDAAMFFPNTPDATKGEPPVVLLLPVTDYKAFIANFEGAATEGDVSTVKFGKNPKDSYVVNWDKYAAIGSTKESIAKKPDGITATGLSAKELESKDIVAYVNMKTARNKILPAIAEHRAKFVADLEKNMARAGQPQPAARPRPNGAAPAPAAPDAAKAAAAQKFAPLMRSFVNRGIDVVEQLVRDADGATYGINLTDAGINITGLTEFAQGSPSGARVAEFKNSDKPLLSGLPATKYMMFGGVAGDPKVAQKVLVDFLAPVEKEFAALGEDGKAMQNWADAMKSYMGAVSATSFALATPSGMLGQDAIIQAITFAKGDAKAIIEAQKQAADSQQTVMEMFTGSIPNQPKMKMKYNENAKTVDGVALNQMQMSFVNTPGQPVSAQQAQMQQMMTMMYGPGGFSAYIGKIADDKVMTAAGANDALLALAVASGKTGNDVLTATAPVQATDAQLPKQRIAAGYVGLDQIATTLASYAKAFGMPINFQVPADLPPVGATFGSDGSALRADVHIPAQTLQSLIAAGMQTYMQMQGGQQPGGPGGL